MSNHAGAAVVNGLDDVIAADTILSDADGQAGTLVIRGRSLDELAGRSTFEEVLAMLWSGLFDAAPDRLAVPALLGQARSEAFAQLMAAVSVDSRWPRQDPV